MAVVTRGAKDDVLRKVQASGLNILRVKEGTASGLRVVYRTGKTVGVTAVHPAKPEPSLQRVAPYAPGLRRFSIVVDMVEMT